MDRLYDINTIFAKHACCTGIHKIEYLQRCGSTLRNRTEEFIELLVESKLQEDDYIDSSIDSVHQMIHCLSLTSPPRTKQNFDFLEMFHEDAYKTLVFFIPKNAQLYHFVYHIFDPSYPWLKIMSAIEDTFLSLFREFGLYNHSERLYHYIDMTNYEGLNLLHHCACADIRELAKVLIFYGADLNAEDKNGWTPLFHSVTMNNVEMTECLLNHRASVQTRDIKGSTALHHSLYQSHIRISAVLINNGSDVNAKDLVDGMSPLHLACSKDFHEITELLLKGGADPELEDNAGLTPLHRACRKGHLDIANILLKNRANKNTIDKKCRTCLHARPINT